MSAEKESCCNALSGNYSEQDGICYDIPVLLGADGSTNFGFGDGTTLADVDNPCTYVFESGSGNGNGNGNGSGNGSGSGGSFWDNLGNIFSGAGQAVSSGAVNSAYCNLYSLFNSNVPPQCRPQSGLNGQDGQDGQDGQNGQDAEFNFKKLIVPIFIVLVIGLILFLALRKRR